MLKLRLCLVSGWITAKKQMGGWQGGQWVGGDGNRSRSRSRSRGGHLSCRTTRCRQHKGGGGKGGRKAGELREQAEFSFCLNLFNGMTRSRRHYHQLHQLHEQSSATWSIGLATCRLPIGERTSWGRAISHKAITVNCFLQARGGTGHTQIHRHSDRDTHRISSGAGRRRQSTINGGAGASAAAAAPGGMQRPSLCSGCCRV